jgi:pimeloyl-ACP methyl ester carboxylesterase
MIGVGAHFAPEEIPMRSASWFGVPLATVLGLGLLLPFWPGGKAEAFQQAKEEPSKAVSFKTSDGVRLAGTFYAKPSAPKEACVLLLHNFDHKKGGNSHQDGWDRLAQKLQEAGYAVLSFDFRGFGDSKSVDKEFWSPVRNPHNALLKGARMPKPPETIEQKDFPASYYPNLVNDVAAAKAYLERLNDSAQQVNVSNLILIGAGEGALIGQLWAAEEWRRKKVGPAALDDSAEGRDIAALVHLTISPALAGRTLSAPLRSWVVEVGAEFKTPVAFFYGEKDDKGRDTARKLFDAIKNPTNSGKKPAEGHDTAYEKAIEGTELTGSQLLQNSLETEKQILSYLDKVMDKRGPKEWRKRETSRHRYFWVVPGQRPFLAKELEEDIVKPIPVKLFGVALP